MVGAVRIERLHECAVGIAAPYEQCLRVEIIAVGMASLIEIGIIFLLAETAGGSSHCPVCYGILHVVGHGLVEIPVSRDEAAFHTDVLAPVGTHLGLPKGLVGLFLVEAFEVLDQDVCQCDYTRVADHAVGLIAPEMPYGQLALLLVDFHHCPGDVPDLFRMDHCHQRHGSPVSIPQ